MITVRNTTEGLIPSLEIKGNTVQNSSNLADIKSVGIDKGDGTYEVSILSSNGLEKSNPEYKEDKCTIKLPCQLEKVGNTSDRLYFDKVENAWCIEKFGKPLDLVSCIYKLNARRENTARIQTNDCQNKIIANNFISNYSIMDNNNSFNNDLKGISINKSTNEIFFSVTYADLGLDKSAGETQIVNAWRDFVKANNITFKYASRIPQKIVLPLDTQIQLNQFLDTTHVWLECGEVDGTIKATFSKSMASTVQTNSNKINILSARVADIEGLKESQDMAYSSDNVVNYNGNIVCQETKNGIVKDLKIKGKTVLVNSNNEVVDPGTEGAILKSVGNGVDEIEVSSNNSNLINSINKEVVSDRLRVKFNAIKFSKTIISNNSDKVFTLTIHKNSGVYSREMLVRPNSNVIVDLNNDEHYKQLECLFRNGWDSSSPFDDSFVVSNIGDNPSDYVPHKSDKKPILFKDTDGTWKPISELRGLDTVCDTIELHSNGKYYYHIRTEKVVLKGVENWINPSWVENDTIALSLPLSVKPNGVAGICDRFNVVSSGLSTQTVECCQIVSNTSIAIRILKSKLETQDVEGFKKWLQANSVTVIYQLAEEKVFEVNPLFLEAYANETMISCSSGAINPGLELKISSYLPNIVKLNEKRISKLENDFYQYTVVQNRLALTSRYNADRVDFKVDNTIGNPLRSSKALDHDLFNLMKVNIEVGKENYNRVEMEEKMDFYVNEGIIDWDMWDELFEAMELQHNPPVDLTPIEPMTVEVKEDEKPKKSRRGRKKKVAEEI